MRGMRPSSASVSVVGRLTGVFRMLVTKSGKPLLYMYKCRPIQLSDFASEPPARDLSLDSARHYGLCVQTPIAPTHTYWISPCMVSVYSTSPFSIQWMQIFKLLCILFCVWIGMQSAQLWSALPGLFPLRRPSFRGSFHKMALQLQRRLLSTRSFVMRDASSDAGTEQKTGSAPRGTGACLPSLKTV